MRFSASAAAADSSLAAEDSRLVAAEGSLPAAEDVHNPAVAAVHTHTAEVVG